MRATQAFLHWQWRQHATPTHTARSICVERARGGGGEQGNAIQLAVVLEVCPNLQILQRRSGETRMWPRQSRAIVQAAKMKASIAHSPRR